MAREYFVRGSEDSAHNDEAKEEHKSPFNGGIILADGNCGWRACYGVTPGIGAELDRRDQQIHRDMENVQPQGYWQPDPSKLRRWDARPDWYQCHSDNPNMCVTLTDGRVVDKYNPNDPGNNFYNQQRPNNWLK